MEQAAQASTPGAGASPVNVRFGVYSQPGNFTGKSVKEVRDQLGKLWGIPSDASAYHGKDKLSDDAIIEPGMNLEFVRRSGEKG